MLTDFPRKIVSLQLADGWNFSSIGFSFPISSLLHFLTFAELERMLGNLEKFRRIYLVFAKEIYMPCMDGYEFIREVRHLPSYRGGQTPAIAFSRFNRMEDRTEAMAAGFQAYLSKPVELNTLLDTIASIVVQVWH